MQHPRGGGGKEKAPGAPQRALSGDAHVQVAAISSGAAGAIGHTTLASRTIVTRAGLAGQGEAVDSSQGTCMGFMGCGGEGGLQGQHLEDRRG